MQNLTLPYLYTALQCTSHGIVPLRICEIVQVY